MRFAKKAFKRYTEQMKKYSSRKSFILKVSMILLLLLVLVAITGTYAFRQFTGILEGISEKTRPDARLLTAEALQNDLKDAEISVKSYSLTGDSLYLAQFEKAEVNTYSRLSELNQINEQVSTSPISFDTLEGLIQTKLTILQDLIFLNKKYEQGKGLNQILRQLQEQNGLQASDVDAEGQKKNFLSWLFHKDDSTDKADNPDLIQLEKEVRQIKEEQEIIEAAIKSREMELIIKDQQISERIVGMLNHLRESELENIANESILAAETIDRTKIQIAIFCVAIGLLLLFMAYIFLSYVRGSKRYRRATNKARSEAEDLAYTKERFLANMSHEMRTPMNAISGFTEQIAQGPLDSQQREQIQMVQKSAEHLLYLINEILDFSKLQADRLQLELIGFKPRELIINLKKLMRNSVEDKNLMVDVELEDNIPQVLLGDPFRLRQILLNLISNAIKFTDEGGIQIRADAEIFDNSSCVLKIEVIDTGIGMTKKQLKKVFEEFVQAESSTSRTYGGTGLGLSIVKMLVDLHRGNIKLTSEPGVGTCVEMEIPYVIGTESDLEETEQFKQVDMDASMKGLHVLVVDDEPFNRQLLKNILEKYKCTYAEASNGKEAIQRADEAEFDVILMDARMPEMNGIDAAKEIKAKDLKSTNSPIIALTAAVSEEDIKTYKEAGMDGFLAKPFKEHQLVEKIDALLYENQEPKEKKTPQKAESKETVNSYVQMDFTELRTLAQGDEHFYLDMLNTFIETTEEGLEKMEKGLAEKDKEKIANFAHKIASPAGHLGAKALREHLKKIESMGRDDASIEALESEIKKVIKSAKSAIKETKNEIAHTRATL